MKREGDKLQHFSPDEAKRKRKLPPLLFRGKVKIGNGEDK
jgi:hypothetical protein